MLSLILQTKIMIGSEFLRGPENKKRAYALA